MAFGANKGRLTGNAASITNPFSATGSVVVVRGDLIFAVVGEQTSMTTTAVADNLGNSYTSLDNSVNDAGTSTGRAFYSIVTVPGTLTSVNATATPSTDNVAFEVAVIEGPVLALDKNPVNITSDITSPFTCPSTGTLTTANQIVMCWGVATGSTVWAATSPNLLSGQTATAAVLHTVVGYQSVSATTAVVPEFTAGSNPTDAILGVASFSQQTVRLTQLWPLPQPPRYPTKLGFEFQPTIPLLVDTVNFPSAVLDWGMPQPLWRVPAIVTPSNPALIPAGVVAAPFAQRSWPLPVQPFRLDGSIWWRPPLALLLGDFSNMPSAVTDWGSVWPPVRLLVPAQSSPGVLLTPIASAPFSQQSWPGPVRLPVQPGGFFNAVEVQLIGQDLLPFRQQSWPLPIVPVRVVGDVVQPSLALNAVVAGIPFAQQSWPAPVRPVLLPPGYIDPTNVQLIGQDQLPVRQQSWPPPILPFRLDTSIWRAPPLALVLGDFSNLPSAVTDWGAMWGAVRLPVAAQSSPLALLSVPPAPLPFSQFSWPVPVTPRVSGPPGFVAGVPQALMPVQSFMPGAVLDWGSIWPVPRVALAPLPANIALLTAGAPTAAPFAQLSWPLPLRAPFAPPRHPDQLAAMFAPVVVQRGPIVVRRWPVPPTPPALNQSSNIPLLTSLPVDTTNFPVRVLDWGVSAPPARVPTPQPASNVALLSAPVVAKPFNQLDWPLPRIALAGKTWIDQSHINLIGQDQLPFNQDSWPLPQVPPPGRGWIGQTAIGLIGQDQLPFRQADWSRAIAPVAPFAAVAPYNPNLYGVVTVAAPFAQYDWPTPRAAAQPQAPGYWQNPIVLSAVTPAPFAQYDWPAPIRARQNPGGFLDATKINLIGQDQLPFAQMDWPNPRVAVQPVTPATWINQALLSITTPAPFAQVDWPAPQRSVPRPGGWIDQTRVNLIGADALPVRQADWPLPRVPVPPLVPAAPWQTNLLGVPPAPLPFNQYSWPMPTRPQMPGPPATLNWYNPTEVIPPPPDERIHQLPFLATMGSMTAR